MPNTKEATKTVSQKDITKMVNDFGYISIKDLSDKTSLHHRLVKIAKQNKMKHPDELAKLAIQLATPKKHPQYMPTQKACKELYPETISTQSVQMKVGNSYKK